MNQSEAPVPAPTDVLEQLAGSLNNHEQIEWGVTDSPDDALDHPLDPLCSRQLMPETKETELGDEVTPPTDGGGISSGPSANPPEVVAVLPDATVEGLKVDQPEVTSTPTEAEVAQFPDENQPSESVGEPFSTTTFNLNHLIATGQVERVELHRYMTAKQAAALKDEYVDGGLIHHSITRSTAGYVNGELVVVWLAPELAKFPEAVKKRAKRAMERMRWNKAENSNRSALKASGGRELNFGWRHAFGKIVQFVPTIEQKSNYKEIGPLVDRLDGMFARTLPQNLEGASS